MPKWSWIGADYHTTMPGPIGRANRVWVCSRVWPRTSFGDKVIACERQLFGQQLTAAAAYDSTEPIAGVNSDLDYVPGLRHQGWLLG
jgi:hypothetical protein